MILFFLSLPVIIGMTGLVIDLTNLYTRRAYAQRAADAAALAGAMASGPTVSDAEITQEAKDYGQRNGYTASQVSVDPHVGGQLGKVQVTVGRQETLFFFPIMELLLGNSPSDARRVAASATAEKIQDVPLELGGNYGTTTGASNPAAFGPYARHSYGDPYSVLYHDPDPITGELTLNDGDPDHLKKNHGVGWDDTSRYQEDGFNYTMTVSKEFAATNSKLRVQLFDPDGHPSNDGNSLDEIHTDSLGTGRKIAETTTEYTIFKVEDDGSLSEVAKKTYGDDADIDAVARKAAGKNPWITPDGFNVDLATHGAGKYKIRVKTIDGSSENGYNLRAGPDVPDPEIKTRTNDEWDQLENDWNQNYGDQGGLNPYNTKVPIQADKHLQMNFTRTDHVKVRLGEVPASAAGKELTVTKFDTDVGSTSIKYSFVAKGSKTPQDSGGTDFLVPDNDFWSQNQVKVPDGFPGGYVYAEYDAGQNDTSSWSIKTPGVAPGSVKLVR